jgi:hypothetical protein
VQRQPRLRVLFVIRFAPRGDAEREAVRVLLGGLAVEESVFC